MVVGLGVGVTRGLDRGVGVAVAVPVAFALEARVGVGVAVGAEVRGVWGRCGVRFRVGSGSLPHPVLTAASRARPTKAAEEKMVLIWF